MKGKTPILKVACCSTELVYCLLNNIFRNKGWAECLLPRISNANNSVPSIYVSKQQAKRRTQAQVLVSTERLDLIFNLTIILS